MTRGVFCCGVDGVDPDACRLVRELSTGAGSIADDLGLGVDALLSARTDSPNELIMKGLQRLGKNQLTGMWMKLFIGTVHKKLRKDVVGEWFHSDKTTYPFMSFLKVKSVNGLEATRHGFLRIA
jgi:hypothetical protein